MSIPIQINAVRSASVRIGGLNNHMVRIIAIDMDILIIADINRRRDLICAVSLQFQILPVQVHYHGVLFRRILFTIKRTYKFPAFCIRLRPCYMDASVSLHFPCYTDVFGCGDGTRLPLVPCRNIPVQSLAVCFLERYILYPNACSLCREPFGNFHLAGQISFAIFERIIVQLISEVVQRSIHKILIGSLFRSGIQARVICTKCDPAPCGRLSNFEIAADHGQACGRFSRNRRVMLINDRRIPAVILYRNGMGILLYHHAGMAGIAAPMKRCNTAAVPPINRTRRTIV